MGVPLVAPGQSPIGMTWYMGAAEEMVSKDNASDIVPIRLRKDEFIMVLRLLVYTEKPNVPHILGFFDFCLRAVRNRHTFLNRWQKQRAKAHPDVVALLSHRGVRFVHGPNQLKSDAHSQLEAKSVLAAQMDVHDLVNKEILKSGVSQKGVLEGLELPLGQPHMAGKSLDVGI